MTVDQPARTYGTNEQLLTDWATLHLSRNRGLVRSAGQHLADRVAELDYERNEATDTVGLPRGTSITDLIGHHRANRDMAAASRTISAESSAFTITLEVFDREGLCACQSYAGENHDVDPPCQRVQDANAIVDQLRGAGLLRTPGQDSPGSP